jgi:translation initiation factor eIF-2B subunit delta
MVEAESSQPSEPAKLSNAELKKRAKAEKQAKRAARKTDSSTPGPQDGSSNQKTEPSTAHPQRPAQAPPKTAQAPKPPKAGKTIPLAHRPSTSTKAAPATKSSSAESVESIRIFNHLSVHRRQDLEMAPKETHPAVQALGLQMSNYIICGSTARCLAMLKAFKEVRPCHVVWFL